MQLPEGSQANPTFHMQLLEPYWVSREGSQRKRPPTAKPIEGGVHYIIWESVESQRDNQKTGKPVQYFVPRKGYHDEEGTWEIYDKRKRTAEEALEEFRAKNPNAD